MQQKKLPVRKNPRMKFYDYATPNYYFVTICTKNKKCIFGMAADINAAGKVATEGLEQIPKHFPDVFVDKYVVMPNHIHVIIVLQGTGVELSDVVGQYKAFVTRRLHQTGPKMEVWQTSFHDHVIRNQQSYEKIWSYIDTNPLKWQEDCFFTE